MAEATAKINIDASGAAKGAKEFSNNIDLIFNADKKAKAQVEKKPKSPWGNWRSDLNVAAGDLSKVTSATGALDLALSRIGGGLKMAGAVGLVATIGKGIYNASVEAKNFSDLLQRMDRQLEGGVANYGSDKLSAVLNSIQQERDKTQKALDELSRPAVSVSTKGAANLTRAVNPVLSGALDMTAMLGGDQIGSNLTAGLGEAAKWTLARTGIVPEAKTSWEKDAEIKERLNVALDRLAEKQKKVLEIEQKRIAGNKEEVEMMELEAKYAERIQEARDSDQKAGSNSRESQLNSERETMRAALRARQGLALSGRVNAEALAAGRAGDAARALGMSSQEEQRQSNLTRASEAGAAVTMAEKALEVTPEDPDAQTRLKVAKQSLNQVLAENAKWERDIARSNADQLKTANAQIEATNLSIRGREWEAKLLERVTKTQLDAVKAEREGNTELAKRIRQYGELQTRADRFNRAINPNTGRLSSQAERGRQARQERINRRNRARDQRRFDREGGGLLRVKRDTDGSIIGGKDAESGFDVIMGPNGQQFINDTDTGVAYKRPGASAEMGFAAAKSAASIPSTSGGDTDSAVLQSILTQLEALVKGN